MAAAEEQAAVYSLWLRPRGPLADKLCAEIAAQAAEYGSPVFTPHVTLLGDVAGSKEEVLAKTQQLAASIKAFRVNFLDVAQGSSFHRCVYLLAAQEPALMAAGVAARQAFGAAGDEYMPHLSLLYADAPPEVRAASQAAATQRLYGEGSGYATLLTDPGFTADALSLWYTPLEDCTCASWAQVAEFPLAEP